MNMVRVRIRTWQPRLAVFLTANLGIAYWPPPLLTGLSDNVGGVKHFSSTLQHALREERHFALVEAVACALPTKARS
jgi:hypothetical protein